MKRNLVIWSLFLLSITVSAQDFTVNAPYTSPTRSTCGATSNCGLETSEDHQYAVNIPTAGTWTFSLCASAYDTRLYLGSALCLGDLGYNDDACGLQSEISLALTPGTYHVTVEGYAGACGNYVLDISTVASGGPGSDCLNPIALNAASLPYSAVGENTGSYGDNYSTSPCSDTYIGGDEVVYTYTAGASDELIEISAVFTDSWGGIHVLDDCPNVATTCVASSLAGTATTAATPCVTVPAGSTYYIVISTFPAPQTIGYDLDIIACAPAGPEDDCTGAIPVVCGDVETGNTSGYGADIAPTCITTDGTGGGVWYSFVGTGDAITASLCGSSYDTKIRVFTGSCGALVCETGNDDACGTQSEVTFNSTLGITYYILVHGFGAASGAYTLTITCATPAGPEDNCGGALPIACGDVTSGNTSTYLPDIAPTCTTFDGTGGGVWYEFTGTGDQVTASLCGSSYDTRIRVYTGTCAALVCEDGNDDSCGLQSEVTFNSVIGTTYYILVHGFSTASGNYILSITCGTPPPIGPEDCAGGVTVCSTETFSGNSSGSGAVDDIDFSNADCLSVEHQSSWYFFQAATPGMIAFDIVTTIDYDFAVWGPFTGPTCPPPSLPLRCSWSAQYGNTGLSAGSGDTSEGAGGDAYVDPINALAGEVYILVIDNFTSDFTAFTLQWNLSAGATLDCTPLPIELLSFTGYAADKVNVIEWSTISEVNNSFFTVERSADGTDFREIAQHPGAGNSSWKIDYSIIDEQPLDGANYYRLKQTDFDGEFEYSDPIHIHQDSPRGDQIKLYPNPASDILHIDWSDHRDGRADVVINNAAGIEQMSLSLDADQNSLDIGDLKEGLYTLVITTPYQVLSKRFCKR